MMRGHPPSHCKVHYAVSVKGNTPLDSAQLGQMRTLCASYCGNICDPPRKKPLDTLLMVGIIYLTIVTLIRQRYFSSRFCEV